MTADQQPDAGTDAVRRGRTLGVDVGRARVGVASADPDGLIATPVATLRRDARRRRDVDELVAFHPRDRLRMAVRDDGRDAVTHYRLRERFRAHTALECRLETGRTHQIRVHMAHLRHPILGDPMYGGALKLPKGASETTAGMLRGFRRQALHAETLEFRHPTSGEAIRCSAPLPDDMQALLKVLRAWLVEKPESR